MLRIPEQLMERATALGLDCCSDPPHHIIRPRQGHPAWYLSYLKGYWVLFVNDTPQIHFSYSEVMAFLNRLNIHPSVAAAEPVSVHSRSRHG